MIVNWKNQVLEFEGCLHIGQYFFIRKAQLIWLFTIVGLKRYFTVPSCPNVSSYVKHFRGSFSRPSGIDRDDSPNQKAPDHLCTITIPQQFAHFFVKRLFLNEWPAPVNNEVN
jgi:hypothetical protein